MILSKELNEFEEMFLPVLDLDGKEKSKVVLPSQFGEEIRDDLIKLAVLAIQNNTRQPYGAYERAGKNYSAKLSRRRRNYRGSYGHGISRVPRKILLRRGRRMYWVGALAPGTVGGRRAHPPKSTKIWEWDLNKKQRRKAIRSALSAVINKQLVSEKGHKVPENYPFVLDSSVEKLNKTKEVENLFKKIGLNNELERIKDKKIRAGKGKNRGRKYKKKKGPLLVVSNRCNLSKSASNIPGVDVVEVKNLNAYLLAPGAKPGRLTLFTDKALEELNNKNLFM